MTVVDEDEKLVDQMAHDLVAEVKAQEAFIGPRPYGQEKTSERDQVREAGLLWNQPPAETAKAWGALLDQKGDKAVHEYVTRINRLREKYPDEANYIPPAPVPEQP